MSKVKTPKGTRDFGPLVCAKRQYIFTTIAQAFQECGFLPIETPAMENLTVLTGKYGEEGDRLIYKVLNSGDYLQKLDPSLLSLNDTKLLTPKISEKGLRYDLTVPFARYVVQHQNDLIFPFKRYQIQPVWRAERPQKGRYREFFQCDGDIIGTNSLLNEIELLKIFDQVFNQLGLKDSIIKLNNRKILEGLAEIINEKDRLTDMTIVIDKLDKIGEEKVLEELKLKNFSEKGLEVIHSFLSLSGSNQKKMEGLQAMLRESEVAQTGIAELSKLLSLLGPAKIARVEIDPTLARGLDYYTGAIFEVKPSSGGAGSIASGGRYDNLTEIFGLKEMPGVGISFGADRIYDLMEERDLFPGNLAKTCDVLIAHFDEGSLPNALSMTQKVKEAGYSCMIYPAPSKIKKQMKYANALQIPLVIICGESEIENQTFILKNMTEGSQSTYSLSELPKVIKKEFSSAKKSF